MGLPRFGLCPAAAPRVRFPNYARPPGGAPTVSRFGDICKSGLFVSEQAARAGVTVVNRSSVQDLVVLKHFGPGNEDLAQDQPPQ